MNVRGAPLSVLVLIDHYLPGFKSGGPAKTLRNMTDALGNEMRFSVLTSDRDLGDDVPYTGFTPGVWQPVGKTMTYYLAPHEWRPVTFRRLIQSVTYDVLYLNSAFSPRTTLPILLMRRFGLLPRRPIVLAPRGEFSEGALKIKARKKKVFFVVARLLHLYQGVLWQASSNLESADIYRVAGATARVHIAPDCTEQVEPEAFALHRVGKTSGRLRLVFLSRISPMKNLLGALRILQRVKGDVGFDIYGPIEDQAYWAECEAFMTTLPPNVKARYCGPVRPEEVHTLFARYDAFLFPTLGENFGHVIVEALLSGCPVVLSDQTPWTNLESDQAGWNYRLDQPGAFVGLLERLGAMTEEEHAVWRRGARDRGLRSAHDDTVREANAAMFALAVRQNSRN